MRIAEIREKTIFTGEARKSATMDFSDMTTGLIAVVTDVVRDGKPVVGFGFSGTGRYSQNGILRERFLPRLRAAAPEELLNDAGDNFDPFRIRDCVMKREKTGGHGDRAVAVATLDMAVWDAVAKIEGKSLCRLLAERWGDGAPADRIAVYVGGGYYAPDNGVGELRDEIRRHRDDGFTTVKIKIGGAPLAEDLRRIEAALDVVSPENLAVDANGRFDLSMALGYAEALAPLGLRWYEDAGYPLDFALQAELAARYEGSLATGENLLSMPDCRNLIRYGGLRPAKDYLLFDCALSYGIVEYIRILEMVEAHGWSRRRCWPHGGHLLSLHIAAGLGLGGTECYPRTHQPIGGFADGIPIVDGHVGLPDAPGLGFEAKANLHQAFRSLLD